MSNRAHHPADRDSTEFIGDEPRPPEASGPELITEIESREFAVAAAGGGAAARDEPAAAEDDDDAVEVAPEPDSEPRPTPPVVGAEPAPAPDEAELPIAGAVSDVRALTGRPSEPPADGALDAGARRSSRPPPLPELSPAEIAASQSALSGTAAEMTAAELESAPAGPDGAAERGWKAGDPVPEGQKRPSFRPPFVDEVPDPVTPYEQRVSETVKVADLPPVEQSRGRVLANRYLAEEVAEHTAQSISYRAYHLALDRAVTVRILLRGLACSDEACQEVRRVAAIATSLEHAHVAATLDFGVLSDGWPFVVTENFQGSTLSAILANDGKFVLRRVLHVGKQIALGLSAAHEKGVVHGLLSTDNVLIVEPGSSAEVAKILGFGIANARGAVPGPPRSGVFGVPFYVSPEQAACRPIDVRSDIYSLGIILYELMTGAPPFSDGDFAGVLCQHLDDDAPSPSTKLPSPGALAKALDAIIERCLRKEPEKRYQTAAELADDLVRLEAAAARSKRRPMPEVQKPTTTIHSPHRKAEAPEVPGAKVIVHDDVDDVSPEAPEVSARRSSPSITLPAKAGSARPSRPPASPAPVGNKSPRVRVDQATIKISASDRDRFMLERRTPPTSAFGVLMAWLRATWLVALLRRFFAPAPRRGGNAR